jgi:hypothetical protein
MDASTQTEDITQQPALGESAVPNITAENPNQGYEDHINVTLPSRGVTLRFENGTSDDTIKKVIQKEYPRNGADVNYELNNGIKDPTDISLDDYKKYEQHRIEQSKLTPKDFVDFAANALPNLGKGAMSLIDTAKNTYKAALSLKSSDELEASVVEGIARSARNLWGSIEHPTDPASYRFRIDSASNADVADTVENRFNKWKENIAFAKRTEDAQKGNNNLTKYNSADGSQSINNDFANATSEIADPVNVAMLAMPELGIADMATGAIGKSIATGGKIAVAATDPILNVANKVAEQITEKMGTGAPVLKGAVASTIPGIKTAATVLSGAKVANLMGDTAMKLGQNIAEGTGRMGALESLALNPNATVLDRALATTGRFGGDAILNLGLRTAGGAAEGATIGGLVGGITGGPEGAVQGAGAGGLMGGAGGAIGSIAAGVTGKLAEANRVTDFNKFVSNLDADTAVKFQTIYNRDGLNAAVRAMDTVGLIKGNLSDGKVEIYNNEDAPEHLKDSRGFSFTAGDTPVVQINVDKAATDRTFSHELYHFADSIDQLRPITEAIQQHIVGTWLTNPDGTTVQASSGLLSPEEINKAFGEYKSKIGTKNPEWNTADTDAQKANLVSKELGAEYLSKLVEGSNPDSLLRGFTSPARTLLDQVLSRQSNDIINGLANRLGNGTKPVDSLLFNNLKEASPALNAMLRDLVRAKFNLDSRIELADTEGTIINSRHLSNPSIAKTALELGLAKQNPDGTVSMRPDSELNKEDHLQSQILHDTLKTAPVPDKNEPQIRLVDGKLTGDGISKSQLEAINKNPLIRDKVKEMFNTISQSLNSRTTGQPNTMFIDYGAATKKAFNRITQKYYTRYNDGIRRSQREIVPYELNFNRANEPYMRALDLTKLRKTAQKLATSNKLGPWGKDFQGFYNDAVNYFNNISDPSGLRTRELAGMTQDKATFLNNLVQSGEKGGAAYIRSFTLDRMIQAHLTGERIGYNNMAWQRSKIDWMPDSKTPGGKIASSEDGYNVIERNGKFSAFSPEGEKLGIYDTQHAAEIKANEDFQNHSDQSVVDSSNSETVPGQAAPDTSVDSLSKKEGKINWELPKNGNFMPNVDESAYPTINSKILDNIKNDTNTLAAIHIDRMRVGDYKGIDLQGGMFYPTILENLKNGIVWAFNSKGTAKSVATRARVNNGYVKLILMQEGNVIGNKTFNKIWFNDLKNNISKGKITEEKALKTLNDAREKFAKNVVNAEGKVKKGSGHIEEWTSLDQAEKQIDSMAQTKRASTYYKKSNTKGKISYQSLLTKTMSKMGMPDAIEIVNNIEDPRFKNIPKGAAVAIIKFDPIQSKADIKTAQEHGVPEHLSYKYVLKGKPVTKLEHYHVIDEKFPKTKNKIMTQANYDFPIEDSIPSKSQAAGLINWQK